MYVPFRFLELEVTLLIASTSSSTRLSNTFAGVGPTSNGFPLFPSRV